MSRERLCQAYLKASSRARKRVDCSLLHWSDYTRGLYLQKDNLKPTSVKRTVSSPGGLGYMKNCENGGLIEDNELHILQFNPTEEALGLLRVVPRG